VINVAATPVDGESAADREAPEILDRLLWQDAQHMLARHTPVEGLGTDDDSCAWCGRSWPCAPRRLAERAAIASTRTWQQAWTARHDLNSLRSLPSLRTELGSSIHGLVVDRAESSRSDGDPLDRDLNGLDPAAVRRPGINRGRFD